MIVVSDASPINVLVRIGHIDVLAPLFGSVLIPPAVVSELSHTRTPDAVRNWIASRPAWLEIRAPLKIDATLQMDDPGEVEAISLALELKADFLLADDRKARRAATERGLPKRPSPIAPSNRATGTSPPILGTTATKGTTPRPFP